MNSAIPDPPKIGNFRCWTVPPHRASLPMAFVIVQIPVNLYGAFVRELENEPAGDGAQAAEIALASGIQHLSDGNNIVLLEQKLRRIAKKENIATNPRRIRVDEATTSALSRLGNLHGISSRNRIATECICQYLRSKGIIAVNGNHIVVNQALTTTVNHRGAP